MFFDQTFEKIPQCPIYIKIFVTNIKCSCLDLRKLKVLYSNMSSSIFTAYFLHYNYYERHDVLKLPKTMTVSNDDIMAFAPSSIIEVSHNMQTCELNNETQTLYDAVH